MSTHYEQNQVETLCRHCVFCEYENNTQIGCDIHVLERYRANGAQINTVTDVEGCTYFTLPGRSCIYYRPKSWATKKQLLTLVDCATEVRQEVTLQCDAIVIITHDKGLDDALKTTIALQTAKLPPSRIIYMVSPHIRASQFFHWVRANCKLPWQFEIIVEKNVNWLRYIDIAIKKSQTIYSALFYAGFEPPHTFLYNLDNYLNEQLQRFLILKGDKNGNGYVVQRNIAKLVGGSIDNTNMFDKVTKLAEEQECQYLIKEIVELVPEMKN